MNNIQEHDWAEDRWFGHTGMDVFSGGGFVEADKDDQAAIAEDEELTRKEGSPAENR